MRGSLLQSQVGHPHILGSIPTTYTQVRLSIVRRRLVTFSPSKWVETHRPACHASVTCRRGGGTSRLRAVHSRKVRSPASPAGARAWAV